MSAFHEVIRVIMMKMKIKMKNRSHRHELRLSWKKALLI